MTALQVGEQLADERYEIVRELGRGGMQVVYLARDLMFQREVAVKVPQDASGRRRFHESAKISARVNHPNIAKTLDYVRDEDGRVFLVEELVRGGDLRRVASRVPRFDPHTVMHVLHHLAKGLAASHSVGVIHRDLKPSNVLIGGLLEFQSIKITDFGIARMAEAEIADAVEGGDETTKSSRTVMGAIPYLAPEVIETPREVFPAADVWSIGAIAWELLAGAPPFGRGLPVVARVMESKRDGKHPELAVDVSGHAQFGSLSQEVGGLLLQCMAFDPVGRPSAKQLAEACEEICYMAPAGRSIGQVEHYPFPSFGFIESGAEKVFFHVQNVVGARPSVGAEVWYARFPGHPHPRAFPVVPLQSP